MTVEIRSEIQKKNKLYVKAKKSKDSKEWEEFKDLRNKVTRMIRDAKNVSEKNSKNKVLVYFLSFLNLFFQFAQFFRKNNITYSLTFSVVLIKGLIFINKLQATASVQKATSNQESSKVEKVQESANGQVPCQEKVQVAVAD